MTMMFGPIAQVRTKETSVATDVSLDDMQIMQIAIHDACKDAATLERVYADYLHFFEKIGIATNDAQAITTTILSTPWLQKSLDSIEVDIHEFLRSKTVTLSSAEGETPFLDAVRRVRQDRAERILGQIGQYLRDIEGEIIDFGTGDGRVAQKIQDVLRKKICGVDVTAYRPVEGQTVPMSLFDGRTVKVNPKTFDAGICINVLHHERENEKILDELDRIVKKRLVIIETVPDGDTSEEAEKDKARVFMNDYLSNRIIHGAMCGADIPVPGAYDTPKGWASRLEARGYDIIVSQDLGYDQLAIRDRHHLIVADNRN